MRRLGSLVTLSIIACAAAAQEPDEGTATPQMREMRATMEHMHEQMARIHATDDSAEREGLMREHMESMHRGMMMMGSMMHGPPAGTADGETTPCSDDDMQCRMRGMQRQQQLTVERMEMMHGMLQQMMEHMMQEHGSAATAHSDPGGEDTADQLDRPEDGEQHEAHH